MGDGFWSLWQSAESRADEPPGGVALLDRKLRLRELGEHAAWLLRRIGLEGERGLPLVPALRMAALQGHLRTHPDEIEAWLVDLQFRRAAQVTLALLDGADLRLASSPLPSGDTAVALWLRDGADAVASSALSERHRLLAACDALRERALAHDGARRAAEARLLEAVRRAEQAEARAAELLAAAHTDPLTGLLNRRRLLELADIEIARARRHKRRLSVLLVDVDRFKLVNDALGHAAGDAVLQDLARACSARLRAGDLLARWGGEEFLALLPDTDPPGAKRLAERLRASVDGAPRGQGERSLRLTVSIGYAELLPAETSIEPAIGRADAALYDAKSSGRNRIVGG
ncbi:MAG: GGDEF domain-containing protein [Geminicoccaceae bacterium]